jgi:dynein heavy chain
MQSPTCIGSLARQMASSPAVSKTSADYLQTERRYNYTTPKSFLELISFYKMILEEKQGNIIRQIQRYEQGLAILAETQSKVEGL